jgi:hypothetical protein
MADKAMDVYLNDHLAGAMLGSDLAEQIRNRHEGTPLGEVMRSIAPQVEEDRQTLLDLMERMGTSKNPVKQASGWLAEKASRVKFSGAVSGEPDHGAFNGVGEPHARGAGQDGSVEGTEGGRQPVSAASVDESRRADRSRRGAAQRPLTRAPGGRSARAGERRVTERQLAGSEREDIRTARSGPTGPVRLRLESHDRRRTGNDLAKRSPRLPSSSSTGTLPTEARLRHRVIA